MDEFQGSFVSFINKPRIIIRPVPMKPEVIQFEEDAANREEDGEEEVVEAGLYEVVPEEDLDPTGTGGEEPEKIVETPEMIYNRLHSELEQLAQACQDDFLYQITEEEYTVLSGTENNFLSQLNKLIFGWCSKYLRIFRVCQGCDFRAAHAREINKHLTGNESCKTYYYALGTFEAPANFMQCQGCNYATMSKGNMNRHQQTRGHTGIDMLGNSASSSSSNSVQQQEPQQVEGFTIGTIAQQEVVQLNEVEEVIEAVPVQQIQVPAPLPEISTTDQNQILADITMWPKDDDSGGHISNLQTRLEQQVENSDNHFIFRISDEEYAALCEQRAHHMAKFNELVNIYCNKTLKLYRVCDGCGFATFMRQDMIKHFETGTCPLSYFNALGTCDDDDPNREVEENEAEEVAGFQITEAAPGAIEAEPTEIEPEGVERYIQPKIPKTDAIFKCPHCNQEMSVRNRSRHIKLNCRILSGKGKKVPHKIPQNKQCWHCPMTFNTWVKLKHHVRINHPDSDPDALKCEDCHKQFKLLYHLNRHKSEDCPVILNKLRKVFTPVKIQCQHCQIYFVEMADLLRHQSKFCKAVQKQSQETSGQKMLLQCKDCLIICGSATDLARHQKDFCRKRPGPLESVIKVEPTRVDGGVELG